MSFDQVWTTIPQEIWSDHQKGKMVKIRVLTEKVQFLSFDLTHDLLVWDMISRIQMHNLDLMEWLKTFPKDQLIDSWTSVNWWKVNRHTKSQTLTFWSTLNFKNQESSRYSKLSSLIIKNQQSQQKAKIENIPTLIKFSKC